MEEVAQQNQEIVSYIGLKRFKEIKKMTKEEMKIFNSFNVFPEGTYLVEGTTKSLSKFKSYYLGLCAHERPAYCQHMLSEFVENCVHGVGDDELIARLEAELTFIYCHNELLGRGNTENWMESYILSKAVNRNRKGLKTVILTERELPILQKSSEIKYINLIEPFKDIRIRTYLDNVSNSTSSSTNSGTSSINTSESKGVVTTNNGTAVFY